MAATLGVLVAIGSAGCARWDAKLPLITFDTERGGIKLLRPRARASACHTRFVGSSASAQPSALDKAARQLLALDPEADALANVTIATRTQVFGLVERTCVTVEADVVRMISVIRLPPPPGHHGHH